MGFAHGSLVKDKAAKFVTSVWGYFESQIESVLPDLPKWLQESIADVGELQRG
jgi:hypothetical protein